MKKNPFIRFSLNNPTIFFFNLFYLAPFSHRCVSKWSTMRGPTGVRRSSEEEEEGGGGSQVISRFALWVGPS